MTPATKERQGKAKEREKTLRGSVQSALDVYFSDLNGHNPGNLYRMVMDEVEAPLLESVMRHTGGNQTRAAECLGINRATLRKKLKQYGLDQ